VSQITPQPTPSGDKANSLQIDGMALNDAIAMHLLSCTQCREAIEHLRPVPLGGKSGHCSDYWQLQLMRAQWEGNQNNIVAYTEFGDAARKSRPLG
jgi:hypothetical protein